MPSAARLGDSIGHVPPLSPDAKGDGGPSGVPTGLIIKPCSGDVFINGIPAARANIDPAVCALHPPLPLPIVTGSSNVFINGQPAARRGDLIKCGAVIIEGSSNVFIGGGPTGGGTVQTALVMPEGEIAPMLLQSLLIADTGASSLNPALSLCFPQHSGAPFPNTALDARDLDTEAIRAERSDSAGSGIGIALAGPLFGGVAAIARMFGAPSTIQNNLVIAQTGMVGSVSGVLARNLVSAPPLHSPALQRVNRISGTKPLSYPEGLNFGHNIPKHLNGPDGFSQKSGISGTHNLDEFMQAAARHKVNVVAKTPGATKGITNIEYQIPSVDKAGAIATDATGSPIFKNQIFTKTVYDPSYHSSRKMLELGQQAAATGYQSALADGVRAYNAEAGGIPFRIYVDPQTGLITNFHPR